MIFCFWQNCCYGDKEYNTRIWVEHQGLGKVWLGLVCWQSAYSEKMGSIPALALRKQLKKQPWWYLLSFPWALWGSTLGQETIVPSRDERFCWSLGWRLSQAEQGSCWGCLHVLVGVPLSGDTHLQCKHYEQLCPIVKTFWFPEPASQLTSRFTYVLCAKHLRIQLRTGLRPYKLLRRTLWPKRLKEISADPTAKVRYVKCRERQLYCPSS